MSVRIVPHHTTAWMLQQTTVALLLPDTRYCLGSVLAVIALWWTSSVAGVGAGVGRRHLLMYHLRRELSSIVSGNVASETTSKAVLLHLDRILHIQQVHWLLPQTLNQWSRYLLKIKAQ
ncbi:hypothetical protein R1flu_009491 [Riccia fluitans]|uniref:Secreted protein n=1 Tax=Riccia fluitans TaxID=41844 RepID=A0ABD1Z3C5_9MARC